MGMPDTARRFMVDQVLAFPDDGNRYQLVDGELLVTPDPDAGDERPRIVTDALLWRVAPDAEELVIGLEELFRHLTP
jgi:hypothetical protein